MMLALCVALVPVGSSAADEEGCLLCHRLPLRQHPSGGRMELRVQAAPGGIHASLFCSDCHGDARVAPHPAPPGPASCVGECHGGKPDRVASHRRASFGGLTETHRRIASPAAPCLLCHKADDRPGDAAGVASRCGGCHEAELTTAERGVHGRIAGARETGLCPSCHRPHPPSASAGESGPSCDGKGCHAGVTPGMRRLSGHGNHERGGGGGVAAILVFASVASGGWLIGELLGASAGKGDNG